MSALNFLNKIKEKHSLVGQELTMSTSPWTSGSTITVKNANKYMVFLLFQETGSTPDILLGLRRASNIITGFAITGSGSNQYVETAYINTNGNSWTLNDTSIMTHTVSSNHSAVTTRSINKIIGLIPINQEQ